jgi:light-independent protochlorophyllide reductase subunit B
MGFEGANVIFDTWVHPLMMGLEEHLIHMFREDFEFNDSAAASHLGHGASKAEAKNSEATTPAPVKAAAEASGWAPDAEKELQKVPFFVRGKARRNTERYALEKGVSLITIETLYDAKAHYSR